jgi:hypothetical protein
VSFSDCSVVIVTFFFESTCLLEVTLGLEFLDLGVPLFSLLLETLFGLKQSVLLLSLMVLIGSAMNAMDPDSMTIVKTSDGFDEAKKAYNSWMPGHQDNFDPLK